MARKGKYPFKTNVGYKDRTTIPLGFFATSVGNRYYSEGHYYKMLQGCGIDSLEGVRTFMYYLGVPYVLMPDGVRYYHGFWVEVALFKCGRPGSPNFALKEIVKGRIKPDRFAEHSKVIPLLAELLIARNLTKGIALKEFQDQFKESMRLLYEKNPPTPAELRAFTKQALRDLKDVIPWNPPTRDKVPETDESTQAKSPEAPDSTASSTVKEQTSP